MTRRLRQGAAAGALGAFVLIAGALRAADEPPAPGTVVPPTALRELAELRRRTGCVTLPTDDEAREIVFHGWPALEIRGRDGEAPGTQRDLAVFDRAAGRLVSYTCFANASTRTSGEAIVSLAGISSSADKLPPALLPGSDLVLESVHRYQEARTQSIYYEARYTNAADDYPFLEAPVRLLLNATTGALFRLEIDPDWFSPPGLPRARISKKAAERIAAVVVGRGDLAAAFGPVSVLGKGAGPELYTVRPNDRLGLFAGGSPERARVAWVVPFRVAGGEAAGLHYLYVDAATGRIIGESSAQQALQLPR